MVLKIANHNYKVKRLSIVKKSNGETFGEWDSISMTIVVDKYLKNSMYKETLLHEVLHGLDYHNGINLTHKQIDALTAGLLQVIRDNPLLVRHLTQED